MGLALRPGTRMARTAGGAHLLGPAGETTVSGRSAFAVLERMSPHLDGTHALEERIIREFAAAAASVPEIAA